MQPNRGLISYPRSSHIMIGRGCGLFQSLICMMARVMRFNYIDHFGTEHSFLITQCTCSWAPHRILGYSTEGQSKIVSKKWRYKLRNGSRASRNGYSLHIGCFKSRVNLISLKTDANLLIGLGETSARSRIQKITTEVPKKTQTFVSPKKKVKARHTRVSHLALQYWF